MSLADGPRLNTHRLATRRDLGLGVHRHLPGALVGQPEQRRLVPRLDAPQAKVQVRQAASESPWCMSETSLQ